MSVCRFISAEKARTPVSMCCRLLGVSRSGLLEDVGAGGPQRHKAIQRFIKQYRYAPEVDVSRVANELYQEAIVTTVALKDAKVRWIAPDLDT